MHSLSINPHLVYSDSVNILTVIFLCIKIYPDNCFNVHFSTYAASNMLKGYIGRGQWDIIVMTHANQFRMLVSTQFYSLMVSVLVFSFKNGDECRIDMKVIKFWLIFVYAGCWTYKRYWI